MNMKTKKKASKIIGWKEWINLECLALPAIKSKIDTGAKTSALHALNIETFFVEDVEYVSFEIHPLQKSKRLIRKCIARVIDRRMVSDSSGRKEKRIVITSNLKIGDNNSIRIELTLTNRDNMVFRMLLGREAIKQLKMIVDVSKSFVQGKAKRNKILKLYRETKPNFLEI